MKKEQVYKLLEITFIAVAFMTFFEIIFAIPGVTDSISDWIHGLNNKWFIWLAIWLIMFIQVCIIPIPAYIVLNTAVNIGLVGQKTSILSALASGDFWMFVLVTISAYMAGASVAYWYGAKFGRKALMWCAGSEEEYDKWSTVLVERGKWAYAATVLFPVFPDDLLCLIAGSIKLNFGFFLCSNLVGRTVGLVTMLIALVVFDHITSGAIPWSLIVWLIVFVVIFIVLIKLKNDLKKEGKSE